MKGRYDLIIYVGVDIAKLNHYASAIDSDGVVLIEPFKFRNDADGFHMLSARLESLPSDDSIIIGLESTAHYGNNLVRYLVSHSYDVCVLNPIQTAPLRKNTIRKTKTDKVDTYIICPALLHKSYRFVSFDDLDLMNLKTLDRFRQKAVKQRSRLKIQLKACLNQTFPELQYFFKSGLHQKGVYALLREAPTAKDIGSMQLTHLAHIL